MASLGDLFYNLHLNDFTEEELKKVNERLKNIGADVKLDLTAFKNLRADIDNAVKDKVKLTFDPQIKASDIEAKLQDKAIKTTIKPLTGTLARDITAALREQEVWVENLRVDPARLSAAIQQSLSSQGFTGLGDAAAESMVKAIQVRFGSETFKAKVEINPGKLADSIVADIRKAEQHEFKLKYDSKKFRQDIEDAVKSGIRVPVDPQIKPSDIEAKLAGKAIKAEVVPIAAALRKAIADAAKTDRPIEIAIGPKASLLQRLVTQVLGNYGFTVHVSTVSGLETAIKRVIQGNHYLTLQADPSAIVRSVQTALSHVQSHTFGLVVARDMLYNSIETALAAKKFPIQIQVLQDQARRAVQNALNNARMVGKDDALAFQRLKTGELKAAQAELAKLKAANYGAASAAKAHTSASLNLGGAMGSNIKIAGELGAAMASLYSIHAIKNFLGQVIEIGGELEHQKIALETIYGSGSKMEELYAKVKGLARESPFGVMELTKNIKQLSAYGVAYNEVYDTAKRLSDISAATSVDIQRLILAYGKTKNRTFLDGLEAKQFAYANIPIYDALSKKLTELEGKFVSVKEVMGRIKKREIGFDMVKDILWEMTDEGGKFYNMQEKLAGSVKTSWKLVRDNIELMFGEIAESSVGDWLKALAQMLQGATKDWRTLIGVVSTAAIGFGVYKTAVLAANTVMGRHHIAAIKSAMAQREEIIAKTAGVNVYRSLTMEEARAIAVKKAMNVVTSKNILSSKTLSDAQLQLLMREKLLEKEQLLRLIATRKLTSAQADYLYLSNVITQREYQMATAAAASTKQFSLMGRSVTINAARFKILASSVGSALKSLGSFVFNPAMLGITAISAAFTVISKHNQEMEKADQLGDAILKKAVDSRKELNTLLESVGKPAEMSDLEISQDIERMETAIRDLSPDPIKAINDTLVDQDGHVLTLIERHEALRGKIEQLGQAYDQNLNISAFMPEALKSTKESWFNDSLETNAKDYTNALKKREHALTTFATKYQRNMILAVEAAKSADEGFLKATEGMDAYEQQLRLIVEQTEKFPEAAEAFKNSLQSSFGGTLYKQGVESLANRDQINAAYDELVSDTEKFVTVVNSKLAGLGINPNLMTDEQKMALQMSLKQILDSMESAGDDAKAIMAKKWEETWGVVLMEDKTGPAIRARFKKLMGESAEEGMSEIERKIMYEGFVSLGKKQKENVAKLMEQARNQVMTELGLTNSEMQQYLSSHTLYQEIQLVYTDSQNAPNDLAKELITRGAKKNGYPSLTSDIEQNIREWTKSGEVAEAAKAAKEDVKKAQEEYNEAVKLGVGVERAKKKLDQKLAAAQFGGFDVSAEASSKSSSGGSSGRPHRDMIASRYKAEFADLRDGWAEVQKLAKTIGFDAAFKKIEQSSLFDHYAWDKGPKSFEDYRRELNNLRVRLADEGIDYHPERETLFNDITKKIFEVDRTVLERNIESALSAVEKAFEKETADFNLFEKIRNATGNERLAFNIAFGIDSDGTTDYVQMVKDHYKRLSDAVAQAAPNAVTYDFDAITPQNVTDLPEELQEAWREAVKSIAKYREDERAAVADMLAENLSAQQEIIQLRAEAAEKIRKIESQVKEGNLSRPSADHLIGKINSNLDFEVLRRSSEYMNFFNASLSLSRGEAEKLGAAIKANLDERLQKGTISAKDYADEMEKIDGILKDIRERTSGFGSFLKGGLTEVFSSNLKKAQDDFKAASNVYEEAKQRYDIAVINGDQAAADSAQSAMDEASAKMQGAKAAEMGAEKGVQAMTVIDKIVHGINDTVQGIRDAFNMIMDMADSFGVDTSADTSWGAASAALEAFSQASDGATKAWDSLKSGNIGGVISGVVQSITSWFTVFNRWHDAKLQKDIERSQMQFQKWQYIIDSVERRMEHFLGNVRNVRVIDAEADLRALSKVNAELEALKNKKGGFSMGRIAKISLLAGERDRLQARKDAYQTGGALGYERQLMVEQLSELERQKADMEKMKKKDPEAIAEITDQIDEQRQAIRDFAEEMAATVYGIDLQDWASQIGDALVDAFARGEDAAEAFDKTVSSILRSMVSKMISQDIIAPMFNQLRDYLFGADGLSGAYGLDFELQPDEVSAIKVYLDTIKNKGIPAAESLFNAINEATGGILNDVDAADTTVRGGFQALTENTGDLLASYVNAIRDYCARNNLNFDRLIEECMPHLTLVVEAQLTQLNMIAENTRRNMLAAEAIQQSVASMHTILQKATRSKDTGFYIH